jgi:hypothetical protein
MVWIGEREIKMQRGWVVQFKDGSTICEEDMPWIAVPNKKEIKRLILKWEDRIWSIDGKEHYTVPQTRGYVNIGPGGVSYGGIDSRTIGYYDLEANCKVLMRVDEQTGRMKHEIEELK